MVNVKAFLQQNRRGTDSESFNTALKLLVSRESKVVGIARIDCTAGLGKPGESAIDAVAANVCKCR